MRPFLNTSKEWLGLLNRRRARLGLPLQEELASQPWTTGWDVVMKLLEQRGPVFNHIDSFHEMMKCVIPRALMKEPPMEFMVPLDKRPPNAGVVGVRIHVPEVYYSTPGDANSGMRLPFEAAFVDDSYTHTLLADLVVEDIDASGAVVGSQRYERIPLGNLPTLTFSEFCTTQLMPTGTIVDMGMDARALPNFWINGNPKVMISSEESAPGIAVHNDKRQQRKCIMTAMVCIPLSTLRHPSTLYVKSVLKTAKPQKHGQWVVEVLLPYNRKLLSIGTLFRALGCQTDEEICSLMFHSWELEMQPIRQILQSCFRSGAPVHSTEEAQRFIATAAKPGESGNWRAVYENIINNDVLPHLGTTADRVPLKMWKLASICRHIILITADLRAADDRDSLKFKRVVRPCGVLSELFNAQLLRRLRNGFRDSIVSALASSRMWDPRQMTHALNGDTTLGRAVRQTLAQGKITSGGGRGTTRKSVVTGVSQSVDKLSMLATVAQTGRVNSATMQKDSHQHHPREQHGTQNFRYCPVDVPEGQSVGLTHSVTVGSHISVAVPSIAVERVLGKILAKLPCCTLISGAPPRARWGRDDFMLTVNGAVVCVVHGQAPHSDARRVAELIKTLRQRFIIPFDVTVALNVMDREIVVWCDAGRLCAYRAVVDRATGAVPLWAMDKNWLRDATMSEIMALGDHVCVMCTEEEDSSLIRPSVSDCEEDPRLYTHAEVTLACMLGAPILCNPWPNHTQSCRATYSIAMGKQGMGPAPATLEKMFDTRTNELVYCQRPVATTQTALSMGLSGDLGSGVMAMVAVMTDPRGDGDGIEDPFLVKKSAVDRGMFMSYSYTSTSAVAPREAGEFGIPDPARCVQMKRDTGEYSHLLPNGMPRVGTTLSNGSVLMGRTANHTMKRNGAADNSKNALHRDTSILVKATSRGSVVHTTSLREISKGGFLGKTMLRQHRELCVGDKLASRHGMKGTVSAIYAEEDAPFTDDGTTPDLVMNLHGKISRMSWGEMLEALCSALGIGLGGFFECSPFTDGDSEKIMTEVRDGLAELGMNRNLEKMLYNGATGQPMGMCFMGPIFICKLKHMVLDKMHARWRGPRQVMIRQPTEGRSRDGGFKVGEMEFAVLFAHGAVDFIVERLMDMSDRITVPVCRRCGIIAVFNRDNSYKWCPLCKTSDVAIVAMPCSCTVWIKEMLATNVAIRLETVPNIGVAAVTA